MAQINKPNTYFNTKLYTGTGATQSITGVGFSPDFVWIKVRSNATHGHNLFDIIRGVNKNLQTNSTSTEGDDTSGSLTAFNSDGFTLGGFYNKVNESGQTFVSWNWDANGAGVSNTDGSITSTVSANTTSGFSIVSYTGTGANATVGHGLGVAPAMVIIKARSTTGSWVVNHKGLANQTVAHLTLETTNASADNATLFNSTAPTSSVFSIGANTATNTSSATYIAYCFAEKKGFSKFGSYVGNNSDDGTFIYTGFKPAFVMTKSTTGEAWNIIDNKRVNQFNPTGYFLYANTSGVESATLTYSEMDFLSNGFKLRKSHGQYNGTATHIYMAFAENPLVGTNNIPATAR